MATYTAKLEWMRKSAKFTDQQYSRAHTWHFDGGLTLRASSSPNHVPVPYSDPGAVDPEEAYVAALASCHMLWFLYLAAGRRFVINSYTDRPSGVMDKDEAGRKVLTQVTLTPHVVFAGDNRPSDTDYEALHHAAHEACFLANSVKTTILTKGTWEFAGASA